MDGVYFVIQHMETGKVISPHGVSKAPHLYTTRGKAEGRRKQFFRPENYVVVPVQLTEIRE